MIIDSHSPSQNMTIYTAFFSVIISSALISFFSWPSVHTESHNRNITSPSPLSELYFATSNPISSLNRFISFSMILYRRPISIGILPSIKFAYSFDGEQENGTGRVWRFIYPGPPIVWVTEPPQEYFLFSDQNITYSRIVLRLKFEGEPSTIESVTLNFAIGNEHHTIFLLILNVIFCLFSVFLLILFLGSFTKRPRRQFAQWLTVVLIILNVLRHNPYQIVCAYFPTAPMNSWNAIFENLFVAYFWWYIALLFECCASEGIGYQIWGMIGPTIFAVVLGYDTEEIVEPFLRQNRLPAIPGNEIARSQNLLNGDFVRELFPYFIIIGIFRAYRRIGESGEVVRFWRSAVSVGGILGIWIIEKKVSPNNAIHTILPILSQTVFVFVMVYFHWPNNEVHIQYDVPEYDVHTNGAYFENADELKSPDFVHETELDSEK
jgi:hypothetical protein